MNESCHSKVQNRNIKLAYSLTYSLKNKPCTCIYTTIHDMELDKYGSYTQKITTCLFIWLKSLGRGLHRWKNDVYVVICLQWTIHYFIVSYRRYSMSRFQGNSCNGIALVPWKASFDERVSGITCILVSDDLLVTWYLHPNSSHNI